MRVQAILNEEQARIVAEIGRRTGRSVSELIREAVEHYHVKRYREEARRRAVDDLLSMALPVADWEQMEREIEAGAGEE